MASKKDFSDYLNATVESIKSETNEETEQKEIPSETIAETAAAQQKANQNQNTTNRNHRNTEKKPMPEKIPTASKEKPEPILKVIDSKTDESLAESIVQENKPAEPDFKPENGLTLQQYINQKIDTIEKSIDSENSKKRSIRIHRESKFHDKYKNLTAPQRPEIHDIMDAIVNTTGMNKYEVVEILLINGLRNTQFD